MNDVVIGLWSTNGIDRAAQGVIGAGRELADALGVPLQAVVIGTENKDLTGALTRRVDRVLIAETEASAVDPEEHDNTGHPLVQPELYLATLTTLCREIEPRAVLLGGDIYSQEMAPRLAHRLGGCSMADGAELAAADSGALRVRRTAYGGRATAVYELARIPAVVWLRARGFEPAAERDSEAEVKRPTIPCPGSFATRLVERRVEAHTGAALEDAPLIVSGGSGLGGPEPFADLEKLAAVLGAAVGASRVACDEGWVPPTWQIGQTGKKIAPELYLAIGISGAAQHLLGIADAKVIAAINTDPDAPIFKHAAFGLVEDFRKILPALTEKLATLNP